MAKSSTPGKVNHPVSRETVAFYRLPERRAIVEEWIDAFYCLEASVGDEEVTSLKEFEQNFFASINSVDSSGLRNFIPDGNSEALATEHPNFSYTAILKDDAILLAKGSPRGRFCHEPVNQTATYFEGRRDICFSSASTFSKVGKGLIIAHELMHARLDLSRNFKQPEGYDHWIEEAEVILFELYILAKLGGKPYKEFIDEATRAEDISHLINTVKFNLILQRIFGSIGHAEKDTWEDMIRLQVMYNKFTGDSSSKIKALADILRQPKG